MDCRERIVNRTFGRNLKGKFSVLLVAGVLSLLAFFGEFQNKAIGDFQNEAFGHLSQYQFRRTPYAQVSDKLARKTSGLNSNLKDVRRRKSLRKQGIGSKSGEPNESATLVKATASARTIGHYKTTKASTMSPRRFKMKIVSKTKPQSLSKKFKITKKRHGDLNKLNSNLRSRPKKLRELDKRYGPKTSTRTKQYAFLLNVLGACDRYTELVVVVCSSPSNFVKRTAIRKTWGSVAKNPKYKIRLVFIVGGSRSPKNRALLKNESRAFKDMIQKDFVDSYMNLTLKSLSMLEWVTHYCSSSKFMLKADDDMYINLPNLIKALHGPKRDMFIMGHLHDKGKPVRDKKSKWFIPRNIYGRNSYPPFTVGVAYSMTTKAARRLYVKAQTMSFFPMEDVFLTGIVASASGIPRYDHIGFYDKWRKPSCEFKKKIAEHKHSPKELYLIHDLVTGEACR